NNFVKGSDAVLLITDSSLENVEKSKFFLELIKEESPDAHTAVIGNKQDLGDALKPQQIEKILGLKTYSMIATDSENRNKMIQIIADILEMSAEISPLLRPLLQRDKFTEDAMNALENGEFNKALLLFQKISDLCIELGDDSLGREFYDKAEKIKEILSSAEVIETTIESSEESEISEPLPPPPPPTPKAPEIPKESQQSETLKAPPSPSKAPEIPKESQQSETLKPPPSPLKAPEILKKPITSTITKPLPKPPKSTKVPEERKADENVEKIELVLSPPMKIKSTKTLEQKDTLKIPEELQIPVEEEKIIKEKAPKKEKKGKKEKPAKKPKKRKKEKISKEEEPKISSVIEKPSFLKAIEAREAELTITQQTQTPQTEETSMSKPKLDLSWMPEKLKRIEEQKSMKKLSEVVKDEEEEKILIKPSIPETKTGLKLRPEDFIIKQRPKKILDVPDDAKGKLKTSAYGHVKNPDEVESSIPTPVDPKNSIKTESKSLESLIPPKPPEAKAPANLVKPKIPSAPTMSKPSAKSKTPVLSEKPMETTSASSEISESDTQKSKAEPMIEIPEGTNKKQLEKSLMELKIKKAKLQEMALDFDMQELSGEITTEELKEKKMKLMIIENKTDKQILEIQRMMDKL
ncbi:MAG: hypothetical protein ACFFAH_12380, partial [Promethearchaeota archaeon]